GYGLLRFLAGDPEVEERLRALPRAEVLFNYLGQLDQVLPAESPFQPAPEPSGPPCDPRERRGHLLEINSLVADGCLRVDWTYGAGLHERATVEALAAAFLAELRGLIEHCLAPGAGGCTPSDFPLAGLGQAELDRIAREPRRVEDVYPLSPTQQGILFHSLYAPDAGSYLAQVTCLLEGDLDIEALERAWQRVLDRHPVLRTAFDWEDPERLLQIVYRGVTLPFEREDWTDLTPERQEERLAEVLAADLRQGFDLSRAPLLRLRLYRVGPAAHRLVWCAHHLLLDGWSLSIVLQELFAGYESFRQGLEPRAVERTPYREHIAWLLGRDGAATEEFWRRMLRGFTAPTPLPGSALQPAPGRGERRLLLPAGRTAELELCARRHQLTLNTVFQGLWGLLLSRLGGGEDVVFGATVAGRPADLPGVESMVGLFINTLPLRLAIDPPAAAVAWLRELQVHGAELRGHEHTPLASIARWSELPPGLPLFESLLVFENYPVSEGAGGGAGSGVALSDVRFHATTNYPLAVRVTPGPELLIEVFYETGRLDAATAERVLELFDAALGAFVREPGTSLGELLSELERMEGEARLRKARELRGANARKLREMKRA
ncbi:MAG TPA: condensation domain-containing protein, partial [Thermoanaerobaculia bacterium]|nr:condensation domain-containing protein [Thermoanaerobaculia bacterium]